MNIKKLWIYDLETLDIFTASFIDRDSNEIRQFILSHNKDEKQDLFNFLNNEVAGLIGYNCLFFDAQILEYLYRNPNCNSLEIRNYAQLIISNQDNNQSDVSEWKLRIPHLDLYKIHHFDNKNRRVGLKWCEYMMDLDNIEDMPSQGHGDNWEQMVLSYNLNDVIATKELYLRSLPLIEVRKELTKLYGVNLMNASNSKIGSELLLKLYCKKTNKKTKDVRSQRTYRSKIEIKNIIFPYIKFKSLEFNQLLNTFNNMVFDKTKKEDNISIIYKGFQFDYGKGGIHGSINNKIIESNDEYMIIDADVSSLYPSIGIINKLYPRHLGFEWYEVYNHDIVSIRLAEKAKKDKGNKAIVDGFKEAANAAYGKSNDIYSWMYDPLYTMSITINGQLMVTMLAEMLLELNDSKLIQINTDGLTMLIKKSTLTQYYDICNQWVQLTNLQLEYAEYSKMIIFDVNNYLAFYNNGKYKAKGKCEFENIALHKNKSFSIIPYTFYQYFANNKSIEDTILSHTNIFDFCAGVRAKSSEKNGLGHYELHSINNGTLLKEKLSKTVRYYISNKGKYLYKVYNSTKSIEHVEAPKKCGKYNKDWKITYFNKKFNVDKFTNYDIDYSYYISKIREWIISVEDKQQSTINL